MNSEAPSKAIFILYVADQDKSKRFYTVVLGTDPVLDVPGMTEFSLNEHTLLGLMPVAGIAKILGDAVPHPAQGQGIPRCELYLYVNDPAAAYERCLAAGGKGLSEASVRNWGDIAAYGVDPDGHILALACKAE